MSSQIAISDSEQVPEIALALTSVATVNAMLEEDGCLGPLNRLAEKLPAYHNWLSSLNPEINRLYLGNEFCDRLIPNRAPVQQCIKTIQQLGIPLSLITPSVSDKAMRGLIPAFDSLDSGAEVIVNDWGVLRVIQADYPHLVPVAGRQFCKMIKDPRLPSRQWSELYPSGIQGSQFQFLLGKYGIQRMELDVPPFVQPEFFASGEMQHSVYLGSGYASRGRICKIGCMHLEAFAKFKAGHSCQQECLEYTGLMTRDTGGQENDLQTWQRGNTLFYKHSEEMAGSIVTAIEQGWIDRLIIMGDWDEDHRAD